MSGDIRTHKCIELNESLLCMCARAFNLIVNVGIYWINAFYWLLRSIWRYTKFVRWLIKMIKRVKLQRPQVATKLLKRDLWKVNKIYYIVRIKQLHSYFIVVSTQLQRDTPNLTWMRKGLICWAMKRNQLAKHLLHSWHSLACCECCANPLQSIRNISDINFHFCLIITSFYEFVGIYNVVIRLEKYRKKVKEN